MNVKNPTILRIIRDTREQQPLLWEGYDGVQVGRDTLSAGDYSLAGNDLPGDDFSIIVERKQDCQELCKNLGSKWDNFIAEAEKLQKYYFRQIVVCGPDNFEHLYMQGLTKLHPGFIYRQLSILAVDYGIPTVFLANRSAAENYIFRLFNRVKKLTDASA